MAVPSVAAYPHSDGRSVLYVLCLFLAPQRAAFFDPRLGLFSFSWLFISLHARAVSVLGSDPVRMFVGTHGIRNVVELFTFAQLGCWYSRKEVGTKTEEGAATEAIEQPNI